MTTSWLSSTPLRIGAFLLALLVVFGGGVAIGRVSGSPGADHPGRGWDHGDDMPGTHGRRGGHGHHGKQPGKQHGRHNGGHNGGDRGSGMGGMHGHSRFTLALAADTVAPGEPLRFQILDPRGRAVSTYDTVHGRRLHLIVVERPGTDRYAHLHPTLSGSTWSVPGPTVGPGSYRMFADFTPTGGEATVAARDLLVRGHHPLFTVPKPARSFAVDGYTVRLRRASGVASLQVLRAGSPVSVQPYLGARGHLVAIRVGSMDYAHAHPEDQASGPVRFALELGRPGRYRLYFDFLAGDTVHTAMFTVRSTGHSTGEGGGSHGHGH